MDPETILDFWFADAAADPKKAVARNPFWYEGTPETDATIRARFSDMVERARSGGLTDWEAQPRSWLALLVVLDQFPRNIYRGTAAAFACDPLAQSVAQRGWNARRQESLRVIEAVFCLMPFQHAEDLDLQHEALRRGEALLASASAEWKTLVNQFQGFARKHVYLIERFGRFPHRNVLLGRPSTPEEQAYLDAGTGFFGQVPKHEASVRAAGRVPTNTRSRKGTSSRT